MALDGHSSRIEKETKGGQLARTDTSHYGQRMMLLATGWSGSLGNPSHRKPEEKKVSCAVTSA